MSSKFIKELPKLIENNIISVEVAQKIEAYYTKNTEPNTNRLFTIFGILGATLVGLGIILIMAHNWDHFPRVIKVILAFAPLLIGQAFVGFSIFKNKSAAWKEASSAFLFFAVGASIALVSQIYNIPGSLEMYLLTWIALCIPLLYLTKSNTALILHLIFITYFAFETGYGRGHSIAYFYFALLLAAVPRYVDMIKKQEHNHITSLLHWLFPLSLIIALPICINFRQNIGFPLYITLFGIFYNIGKLPFFDNKRLLINGYRMLGSLGTIIVLLIVSFRFVWSFEIPNQFSFLVAPAYLVFFSIAIVLTYFATKTHKTSEWNLFQFTFLIFIVIFALGQENSILAMTLTNLLLFALGILTVKIGADTMHFGVLNYGMIIITALIACRFFDTNIPFELRGLLFVLVGAGFFATNYVMLKRQNAKNKSKK